MLSIPHILLVLLIVCIVFGAGKLPQIMGEFGKGLKNFRDNVKSENDDDDQRKNLDNKH